jgi:hypothetical protein
MMAKAFSKAGDLSRDEPDLAIIGSEDVENYIGNWQTGFGFINVRFPKETTRELTEEEKTFYRTKFVGHSNGISYPAYTE